MLYIRNFPHYKTTGGFGFYGNRHIWPKTLCNHSLIQAMLNLNFVPDWLSGIGDIFCLKVLMTTPENDGPSPYCIITETRLYNFDPLKPQFYIVKLGFTGVYIIFLISAQKHRLWYSLEPPRRGGSNEYPQSMFWAEVWKISGFLSKNFHFLVVEFSVYLNRRVFVMVHLACEPSDDQSAYAEGCCLAKSFSYIDAF